ncbi:MAG: malonyl-ACP O-methyltransferase BioC [Zetaproteobacteria bacterium]|nr:malonyl-ACP O-methyltransferase BioC [Zetaproteobacteria bacterium]
MPESNPEYIDIARVTQAFSHAASHYDDYTVLQREVAARLVAHLDFTRIEPQSILDIGCGTGFLTRLLVDRFKRADVVGCDLSMEMVKYTHDHHRLRMPWQGKRLHSGGDATALPFAEGSFDLVTSSLTMQWVRDPLRMMAEMRRVLRPGGLILFSTFGRRTLIELRAALRAISEASSGLVLPFPDVMSLGNQLMSLDVEMPVADTDLFTLNYANTMALARELKGMGASAKAIKGRSGGLYGRRLLRLIEANYGAQYRDQATGRIAASFEVLYAQAWYKAASRSPFAAGSIPILLADD